MKKKIISAAALVCAATMCISFTACADGGETGEAVSFVSLDINPSIEITLDENDKVVTVYGANEDGQVLLYGEEGIIGEKVEVAVGKITALAVELGYLDDDNYVVETSVTTTGTKGETLRAKINSKIELTTEACGLEVVCENEGAYSLHRAIERLKEQYPDLEAVQQMTVEQARLVLAAVETEFVSVEEAVGMTRKELIKIISEAHKLAKGYATSAYNKAVSVARAAYDEALGAAVDGIYLTYYMSHHPDTAYYGAIYQAYKSSARTLNAVADSLGYVQKVNGYPLSEEQIAVVAEVLGLEDETVLQNSDGDVTVKSIEAYADKLFKNKKQELEDKDALKIAKEQLSEALRGIESELRLTCSELVLEYQPQINSVTGIVKSVVNRFRGMMYNPTIPESVKDLITECSTVSDELETLTADGDLTSDEIRSLAALLQEKAENVLQIIENDLTETELAEIADLQERAIAGISAAKENYETAVETAKAQAEKRLEELKAARHNR